MSQEQSVGPSHHQRAPRLRSACNQCCAAKVKCTGEKDGCARCKTLHTECIYTESRVGKVPGIRARTKKLELQQRRNQQQGGGDTEGAAASGQHVSSDAIETIVAIPSMHHAEGAAPDPPQQALCSWPQHWPLSAPWIDAPMLDDNLVEFDAVIGGPTTTSAGHLDAPYDHESTSPSAAAASPISSSWLGSNQACLAPNAATGLPSPRSASLSAQTPPRPEQTAQMESGEGHKTAATTANPAPKETRLDRARLDSECVMVCTHIIAVMENYLLCEPKTLYLVLEPIRKATAELRNLIHLQQESRCGRCISLFTVVLSQMIDLLEAGAKPPSESEAGLPAGRFLSGMQSNIGFSAFSLTADEQRGWQSRIVRKEYHNVAEVVSAVIRMAESGQRGTAVNPAMTEQWTKPLAELKQKLVCLAREKENDMDNYVVE